MKSIYAKIKKSLMADFFDLTFNRPEDFKTSVDNEVVPFQGETKVNSDTVYHAANAKLNQAWIDFFKGCLEDSTGSIKFDSVEEAVEFVISSAKRSQGDFVIADIVLFNSLKKMIGGRGVNAAPGRLMEGEALILRKAKANVFIEETEAGTFHVDVKADFSACNARVVNHPRRPFQIPSGY